MRSKILIVDDEPYSRLFMQEILADDYEVVQARDGLEAIHTALKENPALILMDISMPKMDGITACEELKSNPATRDIPLIFLTAQNSLSDESKGFDAGAVDYILKPISPPILERRVKTHLSLTRVEKLDALARESIHMLGEAGHYNDTDTGVHIWRMADYAANLARAAGWDQAQSDLLEMAAPMHDTGKIGIPDAILKAERSLTAEEWGIMKQHSKMGYDILVRGQHPVFQLAAEVALNHHEKWNGSGYPRGLSGEEIPVSARIVAIADVFDALTVKRPYKEAWPIEKAVEHIKNSAGSHFEPKLVKLFLETFDEIIKVKDYWDAKEQDGSLTMANM